MTRPSASSCLFLCALAAAAALSSTGTEAFVPSSPVVPRIIATRQSIVSATALNAQKKRRRKRKVTAADDSGAAAAAAPAAPSTVETTTPLAPSAKLDAAAELKAAEMAFDLGADGFVGKSDFYDSMAHHEFSNMKKVGICRAAACFRHVTVFKMVSICYVPLNCSATRNKELYSRVLKSHHILQHE